MCRDFARIWRIFGGGEGASEHRSDPCGVGCSGLILRMSGWISCCAESAQLAQVRLRASRPEPAGLAQPTAQRHGEAEGHPDRRQALVRVAAAGLVRVEDGGGRGQLDRDGVVIDDDRRHAQIGRGAHLGAAGRAGGGLMAAARRPVAAAPAARARSTRAAVRPSAQAGAGGLAASPAAARPTAADSQQPATAVAAGVAPLPRSGALAPLASSPENPWVDLHPARVWPD